MDEIDIQTNLELSADFNNYAVKHPELFRFAGASDTCVVFVDPSQPALTRKNLQLAEKITKQEKKRCFKAIKERGRWKLEPVK